MTSLLKTLKSNANTGSVSGVGKTEGDKYNPDVPTYIMKQMKSEIQPNTNFLEMDIKLLVKNYQQILNQKMI